MEEFLIKVTSLVASDIYLSCMLAANCSVVISSRLTGLSRGCIFAHTFGVAITVIDWNELKLYGTMSRAQTLERDKYESFEIPPLFKTLFVLSRNLLLMRNVPIPSYPASAAQGTSHG